MPAVTLPVWFRATKPLPFEFIKNYRVLPSFGEDRACWLVLNGPNPKVMING